MECYKKTKLKCKVKVKLKYVNRVALKSSTTKILVNSDFNQWPENKILNVFNFSFSQMKAHIIINFFSNKLYF